MESKMDENDHVRCVGAIVTNLQALETALRFFLGRRYDQYLEFPKPGDTTARKSYLTAFAPLDERFHENDPLGFDPTFVIPGCVPAGDSRSERRPGIHSPCGGYGFRARLSRASRVTRA